eukprot:gene5252-3763_t
MDSPPARFSRWYPDAVLSHKCGDSYSITRGKHRNPYDLATADAHVTTAERLDSQTLRATVMVRNVQPKFRALQDTVECEFVLRSSITQLGINAEGAEIQIDREKREITVNTNLVALTSVGIQMLDHIGVGAQVGKIFALDKKRVVREKDYVLRLLQSYTLKGEVLMSYGEREVQMEELQVVNGRLIAYLPVLPGSFCYQENTITSLLPTIGMALRSGTAYKDLIRLHQSFVAGSTTATLNTPLMVRSRPLQIRVLFGRVVDELLPKGLRCMSSRIIEPEEGNAGPRDRTFVFCGESTEDLKSIPIEFYTLESYREHIAFALRKTLGARCSHEADVMAVFRSAPPGESRCSAYICKGGQFLEMTTNDWIQANPRAEPYVGCDNTDQQRELVVRYMTQQSEYPILSAMTLGDITSEGVLFTRYFPSPCLKPILLSRTAWRKLRAIYFSRPSQSHGNFFSQDDVSLLADLITFGVSVFHVDERKGKFFQYILRQGRNTGLFVPLERRQEYIQATFFGVYGSNLVAGDFEAELRYLLSGIQHVKKTCNHPLLNASKPLALVTGGGPGAMEVGNRVAKSLGILSCGLVVDFGSVASKPGATINEQKMNPFIDAYFNYRADKLVERQSDFNLDFPIFLTGGIGTDFEYALEEVRRKVATTPPHPMILFGSAEHWGGKISGRYRENLRSGTIKGSEWISTIPWVVETGKEALEVYRDFFYGVLPVGPGHPPSDRGFMVAKEYLANRPPQTLFLRPKICIYIYNIYIYLIFVAAEQHVKFDRVDRVLSPNSVTITFPSVCEDAPTLLSHLTPGQGQGLQPYSGKERLPPLETQSITYYLLLLLLVNTYASNSLIPGLHASWIRTTRNPSLFALSFLVVSLLEGYKKKGWLLMAIVAAVLLTAIAVPMTYFTSTQPRNIYVAIACVAAWLIYMLCCYLMLYRPLHFCVQEFNSNHSPSDHSFFLKELNEMSEVGDHLSRERRALIRTIDRLTCNKDRDIHFMTPPPSPSRDCLTTNLFCSVIAGGISVSTIVSFSIYLALPVPAYLVSIMFLSLHLSLYIYCRVLFFLFFLVKVVSTVNGSHLCSVEMRCFRLSTLLVLLGLWLVVASPLGASAFRFDLMVKEKRCFTEEIASEVDVSVTYVAGDGYGQFVDVFLTHTPEGGAFDSNKLLIWKDVGNTKGQFKQRFTSGGELELCLVSRVASGMTVKSTEKRPVTLDFVVGADARSFEKAATSEKMWPILAQLRHLESSARDILGEYQYYKSREQEMRSTNEHMTARIMWAAVVVIMIIAGFSYMQVKQIERYLRKKRMID